MPCSCHGKRGESVKTASPYDQCTMCARKHVKNAWGAYNEFTYEQDNRDYVSDQLRKAADHLKFEHRETALKCRDMAMEMEGNEDVAGGGMAKRLNDLRIETLALFYADHPEASERLEKAKENVK